VKSIEDQNWLILLSWWDSECRWDLSLFPYVFIRLFCFRPTKIGSNHNENWLCSQLSKSYQLFSIVQTIKTEPCFQFSFNHRTVDTSVSFSISLELIRIQSNDQSTNFLSNNYRRPIILNRPRSLSLLLAVTSWHGRWITHRKVPSYGNWFLEFTGNVRIAECRMIFDGLSFSEDRPLIHFLISKTRISVTLDAWKSSIG
jgi:hypothetical protein